MLSARRLKNTSVIDRLLADPHEFSFLQVVNLSERALIYNYDAENIKISEKIYGLIGEFNIPKTETIEFYTKPSFAFQEVEVSKIELSHKNAIRAQVDFIGLCGAAGVLPYHYTEFLLKRSKEKDDAFSHFIDFFNHRITSLFYRSQIKYSLPLSLQRDQINDNKFNERVSHTDILLSLVGLGTKNLANRLNFSDNTLIYYGGYFSNPIRNATNLRSMLSDYFDIKIEIDQFIGQWQDLIPDVLTQMGTSMNRAGLNSCLGQSAMLGKRAWIAQGKIRIVLGPLNKDQLNTFAPGTKVFSVMNQMVQMYLGLEHDYEFVMEIQKNDLPKNLLMNSKSPPRLGWDTWVMGSSANIDKNETIRIKVSGKNIK